MLDACGLQSEYYDAPQTQAGLLHLFEELKRKETNGCAVGWPPLWAGQLDTDAQLEAEA